MKMKPMLVSPPPQLFLFLQDFSQRMLSKTHEIEKQLDGLIRDTKATDCCVHTVFNDFLMLSNTQFIENVRCGLEIPWSSSLEHFNGRKRTETGRGPPVLDLSNK